MHDPELPLCPKQTERSQEAETRDDREPAERPRNLFADWLIVHHFPSPSGSCARNSVTPTPVLPSDRKLSAGAALRRAASSHDTPRAWMFVEPRLILERCGGLHHRQHRLQRARANGPRWIVLIGRFSTPYAAMNDLA